FDSPVRGTILPMRLLPDEHYHTKACNDADSCATLRAGVRGISLAAPLDAQTWAKVQTGLLPRLSPDLAGALHRDAVELPARADRTDWETGHSLHDHLQSLRQMG